MSEVRQMKRKLKCPPAGQPYLMSAAEGHFIPVPGIAMSKERSRWAAGSSLG